MEKKKKVLFVCSANTCRSAVAESILREYGGDRYDVSSAGLFAHAGEPMMQGCADALSLLFGRSVSALSHSATRLCSEQMRENDIVVAVSEGYASMIRSYFSAYADKVRAFPGYGIRDISCLSDEEMLNGILQIRDGIAEMFDLKMPQS